MNDVKSRLVEEFANAEYAQAYMAAHTVSTLSAQVYWTRKARGLTQAQLAQRCGMAQERISLIEAGEFNSLTMATLRKLARALDVNLRMEFEPFCNAIHSVTQQTKSHLELPGRTESLKAFAKEHAVVADLYGSPVMVTIGLPTNPKSMATQLAATSAAPPYVVAQAQTA